MKGGRREKSLHRVEEGWKKCSRESCVSANREWTGCGEGRKTGIIRERRKEREQRELRLQSNLRTCELFENKEKRGRAEEII